MNKKNYHTNLTNEQINSVYGKLPPQAIDVEIAVLGALMLERDAIYKVKPLISDDTFYKEEHRLIYKTVFQLSQENKNIDLVTVSRRLQDDGILEKIGGPGYITELTRNVASAAHIEQHCFILHEKYILREMIIEFSGLITKAFEGNFDSATSHYADATQNIDSKLAGNSNMMHIADILKNTSADLELRQQKAAAGETPGITTGLLDFDRLNNGWQPGDLIIVAARPSMGKTAIALNLFAKSPAIKNKNVCVFSLEMENLKLSKRLILSYGGINRKNFERGTMTQGDWQAYNSAVGHLEKLPIYIDDKPATTANYIDATLRNKVRKNECDIAIIDYLQLVESPPGFSNKNREREVAEISRGLKKTAKATGIPIILLAQLNRGLENRDDKKPRLSDLRESGAIEQDADIVIFPWRPSVYDPDATDSTGASFHNIMLLEIAKFRDGQTGTILAKHNDDLTQFFDCNTYNQQEPNSNKF